MKTAEEAFQKIIDMNRQQALDQYGNAEKAEQWACVVVAREGIAMLAQSPAINRERLVALAVEHLQITKEEEHNHMVMSGIELFADAILSELGAKPGQPPQAMETGIKYFEHNGIRYYPATNLQPATPVTLPMDIDLIISEAERLGWVFTNNRWRQYGYSPKTTAGLYAYIKQSA